MAVGLLDFASHDYWRRQAGARRAARMAIETGYGQASDQYLLSKTP